MSVADLQRLLTEDQRLAAALLFGSVARGQERRESDLDLAVLYRDAAARTEVHRNWLEFLGRLAMAAKRTVHVVDLGTADSALVRHVLRDGRVLLDRDSRRLADVFARKTLEYFDWAPARAIITRGHQRILSHG